MHTTSKTSTIRHGKATLQKKRTWTWEKHFYNECVHGNNLSACKGKATYINPSPDPATAGAGFAPLYLRDGSANTYFDTFCILESQKMIGVVQYI